MSDCADEPSAGLVASVRGNSEADRTSNLKYTEAGESKEGIVYEESHRRGGFGCDRQLCDRGVGRDADPSTVAAVAAGPSCKAATIGWTGRTPALRHRAGIDQRNWGRVFITNWNAGKPIPGVPRGTSASS